MHFDGPPKPVGDRTLRLAALVCTVVLTIAALSLAHSVMTSVAFCFVCHRARVAIAKAVEAKLPQLVAVLITAVVALVAIGVGFCLIMWDFGRIAQWVIVNSARLQSLYMHAADLLEQHGLYAAELITGQFNMSSIVSVMRGIGRSLQGIVTFALVTFMFIIIGVPILIALASLCARNPTTSAIATVLSPDRPLLNRAVPWGCIPWVC